MASVIINSQLLPEEQAHIPISDRGFRYGDGVFETIAVQGGVPYQFEVHIERLTKGLAALKIAFDAQTLAAQAKQLLRANDVKEGLLRIQVTRGSGSRGYLPEKNAATGALCVLETMPMPQISGKPATLWQTRYTKPSPKSLPVQFKLCQGLNSILARMDADENNCFDALLCNEQKHVCETSSGNIFWVKDKILFTPAIACGVLEGSMRSAILRLSPWRVQEVDATAGQMTRADAVFISNVAWKVLAVNEIKPQGIHWNSEALAAEMHALIEQDIASYTQQHAGQWL
jgi:branched-chain amino acid aminotransferase